MKKAWSLFWFVVASLILISIVTSWLGPFFWVIVMVVVFIVLSLIGWEVYKRLTGRIRRF